MKNKLRCGYLMKRQTMNMKKDLMNYKKIMRQMNLSKINNKIKKMKNNKKNRCKKLIINKIKINEIIIIFSTKNLVYLLIKM